MDQGQVEGRPKRKAREGGVRWTEGDVVPRTAIETTDQGRVEGRSKKSEGGRVPLDRGDDESEGDQAAAAQHFGLWKA